MKHWFTDSRVRRVRSACLSALCASLAAMACGASESGADPALWRNSAEIRIGGYRGGSALTDFPVLISLDPTLIEDFDYTQLNPDGSDLRFTDDANTRLLDHEIEHWDLSGVSRVWVRVPLLISNRVIRAFWNNPAAGELPSAGVWDADFRGVWHLAGSLEDSTINANHAVSTGTTPAVGAVAGGRAFDGDDYLDCGNGASLNIGGNRLSLSAWIKPNAISGNAIISKSYNAAHSAPYYAWVLYTVSSALHCRIDTAAATRGALSLGAWQHVAATYDGTVIAYYIDGLPVGTLAKSGNLLVTERHVRIGGRHTTALAEFFNGAIDEVRLSSAARSADWIRAEHDTVVRADFCVFGAVEDNSIPKLSVSDARCIEGDTGTTQLLFTVTLSVPPTNAVSFRYATTFGSADASDLSPVEGIMTIPAGERSAVVAMTVFGDVAEEPDETVYLDLSEISGAVALKTRGYGLILDDDRSNPLSPLALAADTLRQRVYAARHTDSSIAVIDARANRMVQAFTLPQAPNALVLNAAGSRLYVAAGGPDGKVYVLDALTGEILQSLDAGHTPMAPLLAPDESVLYLCNRFDDDVAFINLADGSTAARVPVARQPVAAALSADGTRLFVAEHLPAGASTNALTAAAVAVIDTATAAVVRRITLPPGSQSLRGMALAADGAAVYVTHLVSRFQLPTTQVLRGWMNTAALTVIDGDSESIIGTVLLDDLDLGAANPWDVVCSADNAFLCVSHAGTHEVSVIGQAALLTKIRSGGAEIARDFTALIALRRRIALPGNGPRALALAGNRLFAAQYFSDTLAALDIAPGSESAVVEIALGAPRIPDAVRRGELNYNDARLCLQQWQSCASCHPDARADALNWDLLNDGFGNPKNTKGHLFSIQTPPAMVTGIRASSQMAVRAGFRYIQFVNRDESYAADVDAYLTALEPVPSPHLRNGSLSAAALRGETLFAARGCTGCHSGEYFTDQQRHDIGSGIGSNAGVAFDTPSLRELWRSGPYLHDGRIDSVRGVVTLIHGSRVSGLTPQEIDDLVEYLLSL